MLNAMNTDKLKAGIDALKQGDRRKARRLLGQVINEDPANAIAWWYLQAVLDTSEQRIHALRQVLRLQPDHVQARAILERLERRVIQVTPPDGLPRPVLDATEDHSGDLVISEPAPEPHVEDNRTSVSDTRVAVLSVSIALLAILVTVILVWSGAASGVLGIKGPHLEPTAQTLTMGSPACTTKEDGRTILVFVNNSAAMLDIQRGDAGSEIYLVSIPSGETASIEATPGVRARYTIDVQAEGYTGSGASFEVPQGNVCRVPIQ